MAKQPARKLPDPDLLYRAKKRAAHWSDFPAKALRPPERGILNDYLPGGSRWTGAIGERPSGKVTDAE